ncbi:hypothetical protein DA2_3912 [Desulfovibrio sp. A2]|nr:hypothetical protein DA2_3912 [Desulfovibrio sp. A2]
MDFRELELNNEACAAAQQQHQTDANGTLMRDHGDALDSMGDIIRETQDTAYWLGFKRGVEAAKRGPELLPLPTVTDVMVEKVRAALAQYGYRVSRWEGDNEDPVRAALQTALGG